jgi:hypothetical protein
VTEVRVRGRAGLRLGSDIEWERLNVLSRR